MMMAEHPISLPVKAFAIGAALMASSYADAVHAQQRIIVGAAPNHLVLKDRARAAGSVFKIAKGDLLFSFDVHPPARAKLQRPVSTAVAGQQVTLGDDVTLIRSVTNDNVGGVTSRRSALFCGEIDPKKHRPR
jgi:hypothetical protein